MRFCCLQKTRTEKWYELQMSMQMDREGNPLLGIGFLSNIMKQKEKTENLEEQLQMDSFTRLLNKAAIEERGMQMIERLKAEEELYMLITDIDNFKAINDRFGHICGDHVLKSDCRYNESPGSGKYGDWTHWWR